MTIKEILDNAKSRMSKSIASLTEELATIRTGRASSKVLDRITVDYYGTPTAINQVGNIASPEPRMLTITPWDSKMISAIEKAIQKSDLGLNPSNDGKIIRLIFPEMSEERRKELTKTVGKSVEQAKVAVRNIRRDAVDQVKKLKKDNTITEDDQRKAEEDAQKLTDKAIKDIDVLAEAKKKELMEI